MSPAPTEHAAVGLNAEASPAATEVPKLERSALALHDRLYREALALQGRVQSMSQREQELISEIGIARARVGLKPEVEGVLESLQRGAHERSVGAFERMLTAITDDVLPDYRGNCAIRMEMTTERNMPALDIFLDHRGKREEVTSGAVTNVLSTGLRFISLARCGARRFLLLDEADCWIDGVAVQNYYNVVNQLSQQAGIQTLVITHHDLTDFRDEFRIYRVTDVASSTEHAARTMDLVSPGRNEVDELNEDHIKFIAARNVEAYQQAAIELSPGVTVIQGRNQSGKSGWARMLRAALLGAGTDGMIRHDAATAEVAVGFSDGRVLEYQRHRKGALKAEYAMHSAASWEQRLSDVSLKSMRDERDNVIRALHHTAGAKLPEWVPRETRIREVEGIDIQLWPQTKPVFMLDWTPSARASLLSIGRESGYLYAMSQTYKDDLRADNQKVNEGEVQLGMLRAQLKHLEPAGSLVERLSELGAQVEAIAEETRELQAAQALLDQIRQAKASLRHVEAQAVAFEPVLPPPNIESTTRLQVWCERLAQAKRNAAVHYEQTLLPVPQVVETALAQQVLQAAENARIQAQRQVGLPQLLEPPRIEPTREMATLVSDLAQARHRAAMVVPSPPSERPNVEPTSELAALLRSLKTAATGVLAQEQEDKRLEREAADLEAKLALASKTLGDECPVCHSIMTVDMLLGRDGARHSHAESAPDAASLAREAAEPASAAAEAATTLQPPVTLSPAGAPGALHRQPVTESEPLPAVAEVAAVAAVTAVATVGAASLPETASAAPSRPTRLRFRR